MLRPVGEKELFFTWYERKQSLAPDLGGKLRGTFRSYAREHNISIHTIMSWVKEKRKFDLRVIEPEVEAREGERKLKQVLDTLHDLAVEGKLVSASEAWLRATGNFTLKSEVTHKFELTAEEHWKIRERARRELSEANQGAGGAGKMLTVLPALPQAIREDSDGKGSLSVGAETPPG